jgi:hypothetical protein
MIRWERNIKSEGERERKRERERETKDELIKNIPHKDKE